MILSQWNHRFEDNNEDFIFFHLLLIIFHIDIFIATILMETV